MLSDTTCPIPEEPGSGRTHTWETHSSEAIAGSPNCYTVICRLGRAADDDADRRLADRVKFAHVLQELAIVAKPTE
jgi:hypothetical protein